MHAVLSDLVIYQGSAEGVQNVGGVGRARVNWARVAWLRPCRQSSVSAEAVPFYKQCLTQSSYYE